MKRLRGKTHSSLLGMCWASAKSYSAQFCRLCIIRAWKLGEGSREKQQGLVEKWLLVAIRKSEKELSLK